MIKMGYTTERNHPQPTTFDYQLQLQKEKKKTQMTKEFNRIIA